MRSLEEQAPGLTPGGHPVDVQSALLRYDFVLAAKRQGA